MLTVVLGSTVCVVNCYSGKLDCEVVGASLVV